MADAIKVEIKNLEEVARIIRDLGPKAVITMPKAVEAGGKVIEGRMIVGGPGPGISMEIDGLTAYVGPDKAHWYYGFFETGTSPHLVEPRAKKALKFGDTFAARAFPRGMAPQPFMRPAIDEGQGEVEKAMGEVLKAGLE